MFSNLQPTKEDFAVRVFLPALIPTSVSDHVSAVEFAKMVEFSEPDYNDGVPRTIVLKDYIVYRLLNPLGFVAFKMGRRQGGPSRTGSRRAHI